MSSKDIELGSYLLEITQGREAIDLSKLKKAGKPETVSLLQWVKATCDSSSWFTGQYNEEARHLPMKTVMESDHTIHCTLETGSVGLFGRTRDGKSGKLLHEREEDHADLLPLYYQLFAPPGSKLGVIVFQKTGGRTAYPFFNDTLRHRLDQEYPHYSLRISPFVAKDVLTQLETGRVQEIRVTKYDPTGDTVLKSMGVAYDSKDIVLETVIKAKRGRTLPPQQVVQNLAKAIRSRKLVEMPKDWEKIGNTVTFRVKLGKRVRSMSFGKYREVVPYFDVSGKVKWEKGRPVENDLQREASNLVVDIALEKKILGN